MPLDMLRLRTMLASDEGLRLKPYRDTEGKLTIGFGRNLDDVGISQDEALYMLDNDTKRTVARMVLLCPWFGDLDDNRQLAIANMAYNIGPAGVTEFTHMIDALKAKDWNLASQEMLNSKWANQVGLRAKRLAAIILTGALQ